MTRLPVTFADEIAAPEPRAWPPRRILMWILLFASLSLWIGETLLR